MSAEDHKQALRPGFRFGAYHVVRVLGVGGFGVSLKERYSDLPWSVASCRDGHGHTAPVGSFGANGWGLHDVLGNVWEWTEDCWNGSYAGAPSDGSAWEYGECTERVLRGGSWLNSPPYLRAAVRNWYSTGARGVSFGFRVARTLPHES